MICERKIFFVGFIPTGEADNAGGIKSGWLAAVKRAIDESVSAVRKKSSPSLKLSL
jgi:hypothetical protein